MFIPALKAILPHLGSILAATVPVFCKNNTDVAAIRRSLQKKIFELQSAASQYALLIKELAVQLQSTVAALVQPVAIADARPQRIYFLSLAAIGMTVISLSVTLYFILVKKYSSA